ncbi:MAG: PQQ-dependent sugar dehydrogenase [Lacipirellulaceae bacterium]
MRRRNQRKGTKNNRHAGALRFERLEARLPMAGDTYLVNFQLAATTPAPRYLVDSGQAFAARGGGLSYGWLSDHTDQARTRIDPETGVFFDADVRHSTLVQFEANQRWEFQLPSGTYSVTVAVGDPANNDGVHTINVEGTNYWNAVPDGATPLVQSKSVSVTDGRLTIDAGLAANLATRINYVQIVGVPSGPNQSPSAPTITEPLFDGKVVNPADVHMEAINFVDGDGNLHKSTDWEVWTSGPSAELVWETRGIEGVERLHTHLGDGVFVNSRAGLRNLAQNTEHQLRVRFRDDAGAVSAYSLRTFVTGAATAAFPLELKQVQPTPAPVWRDVFGVDVELADGASFINPSDPIIAIDLDGGSAFPAAESPNNAIDGTLAKYLNFGKVNSGFIVTPSNATRVVTGFTITTANDFEERDPSAWSLFGTGDTITSGQNSTGTAESWTLIAQGGVALPAARDTVGPAVMFANTTAYRSYRMVFTGLKNAAATDSMQIGELTFQTASSSAFITPSDPIIAIDLDGTSSFPGGEAPSNAIDGTLAKYLNFGEVNSGFIVTPSNPTRVVTGFAITTANDSEERDPSGWRLFGTNDTVTSTQNSTGSAENWTLIAQGALTLPAARDTVGPTVSFANTTAYGAYRMVFTGVKNAAAANSMQVGEVSFVTTGGTIGPPATPASLEVSTADFATTLTRAEGAIGPGNTLTYAAAVPDHEATRLTIRSGGQALTLRESDLEVTDELGDRRTIYLPAVTLAAGQRFDLWVSATGATYFGTATQTSPNFQSLARDANLDVPYLAKAPRFVIEEVGADYRLPVNITFVPNPGPNPTDPLYFVIELYGSIQVVTRNGVKHEFATGLLDYNPTGPISGSGEQGLTGLAVERDATNPDVYNLYVGMLADNGAPPGGASHYPKVEKITSAVGGLTLATRTVLLNMQPETQGQSHQISNITIGPDGKLYVHNGDGFDASTALDLDQYRGKVLRLNKDGSAPADNPFYNAANGTSARDYVWAYGVRNPFGGAWRAADGKHYMVENGPSIDRFAQVNRGVSYGYDGSDQSMTINAIYNWIPSSAPVNITFVQPETFGGSQFPKELQGRAFISESGATYAGGPQAIGKKVTHVTLDAAGALVAGPTSFAEYIGGGQSSVVAIAAGPDGVYFSEFYEETGANGPTASGSRLFRIRYVNPLDGDYDIDGDVDQDDYTVWQSNYGSNLLLSADGNRDGLVNAADYTVWRDNLGATLAPPATSSSAAMIEAPLSGAHSEIASLASSPEVVDEALVGLFGAPPSERASTSRNERLVVRGGSPAPTALYSLLRAQFESRSSVESETPARRRGTLDRDAVPGTAREDGAAHGVATSVQQEYRRATRQLNANV